MLILGGSGRVENENVLLPHLDPVIRKPLSKSDQSIILLHGQGGGPHIKEVPIPLLQQMCRHFHAGAFVVDKNRIASGNTSPQAYNGKHTIAVHAFLTGTSKDAGCPQCRKLV